jgi:hypothetical protein
MFRKKIDVSPHITTQYLVVQIVSTVEYQSVVPNNAEIYCLPVVWAGQESAVQGDGGRGYWTGVVWSRA